ncbi:MAG TPA: hypothetical protein VGM49_07160 [Candidatus Limnocylindrales bacterium]|jgi:hypothetical protein
MADLDTELSDRLSRLSAAVPVSGTHIDPIHRTAVQARQRVRTAWLTPLVALVIAAIALGMFRLGTPPGGAAATSTVRDGDFQLMLRSAKARYTTTEPIDVVGELTYTGTASSVAISADSEGPVLLSVREPVFGGIQLGGISELMCAPSTLTRNTPLVVPFKKAGTFDGEHPEASQFKAYFEDPVFRLPAGTWHIVATAQSPCPGRTGASFKLETEIAVVVSDDPNATLGLPAPTPWADKPVYGGDDIGDFTLQLRAGHSSYAVGTPIDISAQYTYGSGVGNSITVSHFSPEVAYSISQVGADGQLVRSRIYDSACQEVTLVDGQPRDVPLTDQDLQTIYAASWPASTSDALKNGILQLPVGRWRITASIETSIGHCGTPGDPRQLHASVEFDVMDPANQPVTPSSPAATIEPTVSPTAPAVSDVANAGPYSLELSADKAIYHASEAIQVIGTFSYSGTEPIAVQGFVPWDFGIVEPVYGMDIAEYIAYVCTHDLLQPGERIQHSFIKSGGVPSTDPQASFKLGYLTDPVLRLPPGTWHLLASAWLTEGTCGDKTVTLGTEIEIQVLPDP